MFIDEDSFNEELQKRVEAIDSGEVYLLFIRIKL